MRRDFFCAVYWHNDHTDKADACGFVFLNHQCLKKYKKLAKSVSSASPVAIKIQ